MKKKEYVLSKELLRSGTSIGANINEAQAGQSKADFISKMSISSKEASKNFMDMEGGDVVSTYADVSGLIDDFGYKPDTSLEVDIGRFVKWYKEFYGEDK